MLETLAITVGTSAIVSLINWLFSRPAKHTDQIHAMDVRLTKAEERLLGTSERVTKTEETLEEICKNMVRKEDLAELKQMIKERL